MGFRHRACRSQRGMALLLTLLIAAVLWMFSMATLEVVALDLRVGQRSIEAVRLFHASDAALRACEARIANRAAHGFSEQVGALQPVDKAVRKPLAAPEPKRWRWAGAVKSGAPGVSDIILPWRGKSIIGPCLAERWTSLPEAQLWLLTVRSPPAMDAELTAAEGGSVWLQSAIEVGNATQSDATQTKATQTEATQRRWWRSVAEPPA